MSQTIVPLKGMRGIIAARMSTSLQTTAQYTLDCRADITNLLRQRSTIPKEQRPSITNILLKVTADTLKECPYMNGTSDKDNIYLESEINLGIAVATDNGLMVPVLHHADSLEFEKMREQTADLIERAKAGKLKVSEFSGGTFTVSNLGMFGIEFFTPVINVPELAILGVGKTIRTAVPGEDGEIMWRDFLTFSLTSDHRAVDGSDAAAFLKKLCKNLAEIELKTL